MFGLGYTCDFDDQEITGELYEARIPRPSDPTDMACILWSCAAHADELGAKPVEWWERWLETEGREQGFRTLS